MNSFEVHSNESAVEKLDVLGWNKYLEGELLEMKSEDKLNTVSQ